MSAAVVASHGHVGQARNRQGVQPEQWAADEQVSRPLSPAATTTSAGQLGTAKTTPRRWTSPRRTAPRKAPSVTPAATTGRHRDAPPRRARGGTGSTRPTVRPPKALLGLRPAAVGGRPLWTYGPRDDPVTRLGQEPPDEADAVAQAPR